MALPLARRATESHAVALTADLYQSGALVFGGGHVVLPLLHERSVAQGWVSEADFVAGYGAAQAVPGPLFTFAGYLGAVGEPTPNGARRRQHRARRDLPARPAAGGRRGAVLGAAAGAAANGRGAARA